MRHYNSKLLKFIILLLTIICLISCGNNFELADKINVSPPVFLNMSKYDYDGRFSIIWDTNLINYNYELQESTVDTEPYYTTVFSGKLNTCMRSVENANNYFYRVKISDDLFESEWSDTVRIIVKIFSDTVAEYYNNINTNLSGSAFIEEIKNTISYYKYLDYESAREIMYHDIFNDGLNNLECVYTGRTAIGINGISSATAANINCEHSWPQSAFDSWSLPRVDMHHLFPCDASANSVRSNYSYGNVENVLWSQGGSLKGPDNENETVFEPRDSMKGDIARAIFYMSARFYGDTEHFITVRQFHGYHIGNKMENILKQWHFSDLPDTIEKIRNDKIFGYQSNRNPFIDFPEWVEQIDDF